MTMSFGYGLYGGGPYGGGAPALMLSAPYLVSSSPSNGAAGVAITAPVTFTVAAPAGIDTTSLNFTLDGQQAIVGGTFLAGYAGSLTTNPDGSVTVSVTTHPSFSVGTVYGFIQVLDGSGNKGNLIFKFTLVVSRLTALLTKTWCDGNRIDLFWTLPAGVTQVRVRRSQYSYCRFVTDPGVDVYQGAPISAFVDGPGPVPASYPTGTVQSTTALQAGTFYYYTIFISFSSGATYRWCWTPGCQVSGLSIKPYTTLYGNYVYNLLPSTFRKRDADPTRGADRFLMRDYCAMLQCAVNVYRGWLESIPLLNDPDNMPAGRIGDTGNINGFLAARSWDLGMPPTQGYDAGVLRRIAAGLTVVLKQKGTCPGLVSLTKMFTTWDSNCVETILPSCGIDRVLTTWDGVSYRDTVQATIAAQNATLGTGSLSVQTSSLYQGNGTAYPLSALPTTASGSPTVACIMDAMGTFACVSNVGAASAGAQVLTLTNSAAQMRSAITGTGVGAGTGPYTFTITSIDHASYPWQYPYPAAAPQWGQNAWAGYVVKDSLSNTYTVKSSAATSGGTTVLTMVGGAPASGAFTLAAAFDSVTLAPLFQAEMVIGSFSYTLNPRWDLRLTADGAAGPWSFFSGLGSMLAGPFAATSADVTVWVHNVAQVYGTLTSVATTQATDSTQAWITNQWAGYFLLANWNQTNLFRIVANDATNLYLDVAEGGGANTVSIAGSSYVILAETDALKYSRLVQVLNSFVPVDVRPLVKFETF
jgi:hypothetical protein